MTVGEPFRIEDVLRRPIFQEAKVVAGGRGLRRPVRWVHVLEVSDAADLLHGEELILTTGVGLGRDEELAFQYVRGLVEKGVSGLCIELGKYFPEVPERVRAFADGCDFPVIVFERPVRFIDITQDIHAHLIDRHHHQLVDLERISRQFLQLTLRPRGLRRILELLHRETGCPVRLREEDGEVVAYPETMDPENGDPDAWKGFHLLRQPIAAMDTQVGELTVAVPGEPTEFLQLVLDRAATAIAQELLRRMSLEERRLRTTRRWMDDLLNRGVGELPPAAAGHFGAGTPLLVAAVLPLPAAPPGPDREHILDQGHTAGSDRWWGSPGRTPDDPMEGSPDDRLLLRAARILPAVFQEHGFLAWLAPVGSHWAVIAADIRGVPEPPDVRSKASSRSLRETPADGGLGDSRDHTENQGGELTGRTRNAFLTLFRRLASGPMGADRGWVVGMGRIVRHPGRVPEAWRQALHALAARSPAAVHGPVASPGGPTGEALPPTGDNRSASSNPAFEGPLTVSSSAVSGGSVKTALAGESTPEPRMLFVSHDDLYTWQLFLQMDEQALGQFVDGQIGPLLAHDRLHGTELVETVRVFFACGQSKQQAAKSLFIHRQTLYYRLEQITALLGEGWDRPPRRLALEIAVDAARFLAVRAQGRRG